MPWGARYKNIPRFVPILIPLHGNFYTVINVQSFVEMSSSRLYVYLYLFLHFQVSVVWADDMQAVAYVLPGRVSNCTYQNQHIVFVYKIIVP